MPKVWYIYVVAVGLLAAYGAANKPGPVLLATLITVPMGIGALVATYLSYGLFLIAFHAVHLKVMSAPGWNPTWWVVFFKAVVTLLFILAAIANATLIQQYLERRRAEI